jgi:hypothetical protein
MELDDGVFACVGGDSVNWLGVNAPVQVQVSSTSVIHLVNETLIEIIPVIYHSAFMPLPQIYEHACQFQR